MSDAEDMEALKAEKEILLAKIVELEDMLKAKGIIPYKPEEKSWIDKMAAKEKKEQDEKPFVIMWGVIAAFIMIVVIVGLVNRFIEWAFGVGIGI